MVLPLTSVTTRALASALPTARAMELTLLATAVSPGSTRETINAGIAVNEKLMAALR